MKKILIMFVVVLFLVPSMLAEARVKVKGYYRKDGTYVRPHYRSDPDGDKSNNYGSPSYQQRKQYKSYQTLPTYQYDYDSDGTPNRYDSDDDNDGVSDNYDSNPYSSRKNNYPSYSYPSSPSSSYGDSNKKDDSSNFFSFGDSDGDSDSSSSLYDW